MIDGAQIAVIIVGYTEILKNLFGTEKKIFKMLISLLVAAGTIALYIWQGDNSKLWIGLTAFAAATLGYDVILKRLKNAGTSDSFGSDGGSGHSTSYSNKDTSAEVTEYLR